MSRIVQLAEDNPEDVRLKQGTFRDADDSVPLNVATDGAGAVALLSEDHVHADAPRPGLLQDNYCLSEAVQSEEFEALVKNANELWLTKAKSPPQDLV